MCQIGKSSRWDEAYAAEQLLIDLEVDVAVALVNHVEDLRCRKLECISEVYQGH